MLLHNIDFSKIKPSRSGIIPYIKRGGKIYFLLGVDTKSNEWSDFGGGVKAYENALSGGLRECLEEIRWIISFQDFNVITSGIMARKTCIMFAEVKDITFFETANRRFRSKYKDSQTFEMKGLVWLTEDEMLKYSRASCKGSRMWFRIRSVLSSCGSFNRKFIKNL